MVRHSTIILGLVTLAAGVCQTALAAPVLPVTRSAGSIIFGPAWCGPTQDPDAVAGQWFKDLSSGLTAVRTHQFHDNAQIGGIAGGNEGAAAIKGLATNLVFDSTSGNLVSFSLLATITNDTPAVAPGFMGSNSFMEMRLSAGPEEPYTGSLLATRLTIPFAIAPGLTPPTGADQYADDAPHIMATNHTGLAWYGWSPGNTIGGPAGDYFVPSWDFGDLAPGQSLTRQLDFMVDGAGLAASDARFGLLTASRDNASDLLMSRSTGVKITRWTTPLAIDDGSATPNPDYLSCDVAVFHNIPEPATLLMLLIGGAVASVGKARGSRANSRSGRLWPHQL